MSHRPQPSCTLSSVMMVQPQRCPLGFATSCIQHGHPIGCSGANEPHCAFARVGQVWHNTVCSPLLVLDARVRCSLCEPLFHPQYLPAAQRCMYALLQHV